MSAFNYNIKIIRDSLGKTQADFAELIKTKESNVKTWETTDTCPRRELIYRNIAELAGVSVEVLKNKKLNPEDIHLKVDKVDSGNFTISAREYINELREDKKRAAQREESILVKLVANSTAMMQLLAALSRHDQAFHETILRSLSRLEGGNRDLVLEAHSYEAEMQIQDSLQGSTLKSGT